MPSHRKSVCLFGLSADPPTGYGGHVGIVQALQRMDEWDEIWVVPVYRHTFPEKRQRLASYEHRLNMCQLAFAHLNDTSRTSKVVISDAEFLSWQYSVQHISNEEEKVAVSVGTAALLDFLQTTYDHEFYFCLGGDSFIDLVDGKWQQTDRILNDLLLCKEDAPTKQPAQRRLLLVLYRNMQHGDNELLIQRYAQELGARLVQISHLGNVSSTQVRNCSNIEELRSSNQMILPQVLDYIQEHSLYQFCKS